MDCLDYWENTTCYALPQPHFDHNMLIGSYSKFIFLGPKPFRFCEMWQSYGGLIPLIHDNWPKSNLSHSSMVYLMLTFGVSLGCTKI